MNNPNASLDRDIRASEENTIPSSDLHQDPDKGPCTAFTALMQYFLLATFTWNTLYAADLLVMFKKRHPAGYVSIIYTVIGWDKWFQTTQTHSKETLWVTDKQNDLSAWHLNEESQVILKWNLYK